MRGTGGDPSRDEEGEARREVLGGEDGRPPVLVLQEGPSRRARRRRRIVVALLVAAVLVGAYLGRDALERWTGISLPDVSRLVDPPGSGSSSAVAVSGDSTSAPEGAVGGPAPGPGTPPPAVLLERRLDSLSVVLGRHRERHGDFVRGRLGCQGLTRGFDEVEDRFAAASRALGRLEAEAGGDPVTAGGLAERYRRLSTTTDSLGRLYVASGCVEEGDGPPG